MRLEKSGSESFPRQYRASANLRLKWPAPIKPIIILISTYIYYVTPLVCNILKPYRKKTKLALLARRPT